jgi:hypothetical protein
MTDKAGTNLATLLPASGVNPVDQSNVLWGFLPNPPPAWLGYVTALIACGVLFSHIYKHVYDYRSERKKRRDDINDAFWFRTVIIPAVIEPLIEFFTAQTDALKKIHKGSKDDFIKYLAEYQQEGERIAARLFLLDMVDHKMYEQAKIRLEEIDDDVASLCAFKAADFNEAEHKIAKHTEVNALIVRMCAGLNSMLKELKAQHHSLT